MYSYLLDTNDLKKINENSCYPLIRIPILYSQSQRTYCPIDPYNKISLCHVRYKFHIYTLLILKISSCYIMQRQISTYIRILFRSKLSIYNNLSSSNIIIKQYNTKNFSSTLTWNSSLNAILFISKFRIPPQRNSLIHRDKLCFVYIVLSLSVVLYQIKTRKQDLNFEIE